jgi:cytochrome c6
MKISSYAILALFLAAPLLSHAQKSKAGDGEAIFQQQCAGCHGPDGKAQTDTGKSLHAADLTAADAQGRSEAQLAAFIKKGKGKMPSFDGKLSDDDLQAVAAYIKTLGKK